MTQILKHFFEGSSAKGARSTALHSLQWGLGLLLTGIPVAVYVDSPTWLIVVLSALLVILFTTYIGSYLYLLFKDRDALRSEHFTLSKMAIERGLMGDSMTGLIEEGDRVNKLIDKKVVNDEEDKK